MRQGVVASVSFVLWLVSSPGFASEFQYHRIVEDPRIAQTAPGLYEKATFDQQEVYVERKPALRIGKDELRLVLVEKGPLICDVQEAELYLATRRMLGREEHDRSYWLTYFVSKKAAAKLRDFGGQNSGRMVEVRVDGRRLITTRFVGKFPGGQKYALGVDGADIVRLKTVLDPISDIVIWK